ncbi:MAG: histidine phosphatase family protein [Pirellulales bacterium]
MKLFCIRHGETVYNLEGRIQGQADSHLSPLGRRQCEAVADALAGQAIDVIVSSPLARAVESARILADKLRLEVVTDPRLMEINAGIFQGHTWPEINDRFSEVAAQWRAADPDFHIPGGESRRDVMLRAGAAFDAILQRNERVVAVMAHGGSLSAGLKALLGIPAEHNPFAFSNGSISTLTWDSEIKVHALNETGHLRDLMSGDGDL